jgi:PEP-CTERM motif
MRNFSVLALAIVALTGFNRSAEAVPIAFTTSGTFSNPTGGCTSAAASTITCDGYTLTFSSVSTLQDVPLDFTSVVNFGQMMVTGVGSPTIVSGGGSFALSITQTIAAPTGGSPFTYSALLTAVLVNNASGSYLQFGGPFTNIVTGSPYNVVYALTESDDNTPGRSRISGLGQSPLDINGTITPVAAVPEPSSLLLLGSGMLAVGRKLRYRFLA